MERALKFSHVRRTRYTEKQKDYSTSKFGTGETTGQKADAASVAKSMITARDSNENRLSKSSEFLTGHKVSSLFSRLASKRTLIENDGVTLKKTRTKRMRKPSASWEVKSFRKLPSVVPSAMTVMTFANLLQIQSCQSLQLRCFRISVSTLISR